MKFFEAIKEGMRWFAGAMFEAMVTPFVVIKVFWESGNEDLAIAAGVCMCWWLILVCLMASVKSFSGFLMAYLWVSIMYGVVLQRLMRWNHV